MNYIVLVVIGILAAIGALTLVAIIAVIRFGDNALKELQ